MAQCYEKEGNRAASLQALLRSLEYDVPRAEICCDIGKHFMEEDQYETAVFWYKTALECRPDIERGGFVLPDCYGYIPAMQLCVCCDKLGKYEEAEAYNERGGKYKPDSRLTYTIGILSWKKHKFPKILTSIGQQHTMY